MLKNIIGFKGIILKNVMITKITKIGSSKSNVFEFSSYCYSIIFKSV